MQRLITLPEAPVTIISDEPLTTAEARFVQAHKLTVRDESGALSIYESMRRKDSACILPITVQNTVLLILQYRIPVAAWVLECPAGQVEAGELPIDTVQKELMEETGYLVQRENIVQIGGKFPASAGGMTEMSSLFYGKDCIQTSTPLQLSQDERLMTVEIAQMDVQRAMKEVMEQGGYIDPRLDIAVRALGLITFSHW